MDAAKKRTPDEDRFDWRPWIIFGLLAVFLHLALFLVPWRELIFDSSPQVARVEVQNIDAQKLEAIRNQWKNKKLLLSKDTSSPDEAEDADYISDRNRKVEREQRAKFSKVMPEKQSGTPYPNSLATRNQRKSKSSESVSSLKSLGVPLRVASRKTRPQFEDAEMDADNTPRNVYGGDQAIDADDLPEGAENMLNTHESIYYSYYSRLYQAIGPIWESAIREVTQQTKIAPGDYVTGLNVTFNSSGQLVGIRLMKSSGVEVFDHVAAESWRRIERFPNPPSDLLDEDGNIHVGWTYRVRMSADFQYMFTPPRREY